jgi:hypothetical protein
MLARVSSKSSKAHKKLLWAERDLGAVVLDRFAAIECDRVWSVVIRRRAVQLHAVTGELERGLCTVRIRRASAVVSIPLDTSHEVTYKNEPL